MSMINSDMLTNEPTGFIPAITAQLKRDFDVEVEEGVYKAVCKLDIKVNKQELMKLLRGDRKSYNKGYKDGMRDAETKVVRCKDCRYATMTADGKFAKSCKIWTQARYFDADYFCADGERKEVSE